jgi:hypothetical protein
MTANGRLEALNSLLGCLEAIPCTKACKGHFSSPGFHLFSGIFLQTITVWPVFESIRVVTGMQRHDTVLAFSCLLTTQCSITSAVGGGIWLRIGAIAGAAG